MDLAGLFEFIKPFWVENGSWRELEPVRDVMFGAMVRRLQLSTGGCQTNQAIIEAFKENEWAWCFCWYCSQRGGHYEFRIPPWHVEYRADALDESDEQPDGEEEEGEEDGAGD